MSFINNETKEINCKVIYTGPAFAGKGTTFKQLAKKLAPDKKKGAATIKTLSEDDKSLYFDFLPLNLGRVGDFRIRLHLYSVPEQSLHDNSRKIILKGVDGLVFLLDSQIEKMESNLDSLANLRKCLDDIGIDLKSIPQVFQFNKRDLSNAASISQLNQLLNPEHRPHFESVATLGEGLIEAMQGIAKLVLLDLKRNN